MTRYDVLQRRLTRLLERADNVRKQLAGLKFERFTPKSGLSYADWYARRVGARESTPAPVQNSTQAAAVATKAKPARKTARPRSTVRKTAPKGGRRSVSKRTQPPARKRRAK